MNGSPDLDSLRRLLDHSPYDDATLLDYALGRLPPGLAGIVELHLEENPFDRVRLERLREDMQALSQWLIPSEEVAGRDQSLASRLTAAMEDWWQTLVQPLSLKASDTAAPVLGEIHQFPLPAPLSAEQLSVTVRTVARGHRFYVFTRDEAIRDGLRLNGAPLAMEWTPFDLGWESEVLIPLGQPLNFDCQLPGGDPSSGDPQVQPEAPRP